MVDNWRGELGALGPSQMTWDNCYSSTTVSGGASMKIRKHTQKSRLDLDLNVYSTLV
jgi:hypothetical protein